MHHGPGLAQADRQQGPRDCGREGRRRSTLKSIAPGTDFGALIEEGSSGAAFQAFLGALEEAGQALDRATLFLARRIRAVGHDPAA